MISRRIFHFLLIVACLLQFTLPFHAVYAAPISQTQAERSALLGDKLLLCTADGFKWVSWADLQEAEHEPAEHQNFECALCFAHSHFGKHIYADGYSLVMPTRSAGNQISHVRQAVHTSADYQPHQSRAPPVS